jgi:hypothetical protein
MAYVVYNCKAKHRQRFFDLINEASIDYGLAEGPTALSRCRGLLAGDENQNRNFTKTRLGSSIYDDAVEAFQPFRFALVFENLIAPGYITEKITNALLAKTIPIYWGTRKVLEIFNPKRFIFVDSALARSAVDPTFSVFDSDDHADIFTFENPYIRSIIEQIIILEQNPLMMIEMINEPIFKSPAILRYFSWHSDVVRLLNQTRFNKTSSLAYGVQLATINLLKWRDKQ